MEATGRLLGVKVIPKLQLQQGFLNTTMRTVAGRRGGTAYISFSVLLVYRKGPCTIL